MSKFWKIVALCDAVLNCRQIKVSDNNLFILGTGAQAAAQLSAFAITTLGDSDFFTARKLSNLRLVGDVPTFDVGSTDFKIAKPTFVRRSITSELLYGNTITYRDAGTGDDDNNRIANNGTKDETQVVLAPYITLATLGLSTTVPAHAQCVVYAEDVAGMAGVFDADGKEVTWLERTNGARVFAKKFVAP